MRISSRYIVLFITALVRCAREDADSGSPPKSTVRIEGWSPQQSTPAGQGIALAAPPLDADGPEILCLHDVWKAGNRQKFVDALKNSYPYSAHFPTDENTLPTDNTDAAGQPVMPRTTAPCATPTAQTGLADLLSCLRTNCSTVPGSDSGMLTSSDCANTMCVGPGLGLVKADPRCFACAYSHLEVTFLQSNQSCTQDLNSDLRYAGENGTLLLSKLPLANAAMYVLPSSQRRQVAIAATATADNGAAVDIYCAELTYPITSLLLPYSGQYGAGNTGNGYTNEQLLQAQKLAQWASSRSVGKKAVLIGEVWGSQAYQAAGQEIVAANSSLASLESLLKTFTEAPPADYTPACTSCPNAWNKNTAEPWWSEHVFLQGIPTASVSAATVTRSELVTTANGQPAPAAQSYGFRVTLQLTP